jgi:hypothetical protein
MSPRGMLGFWGFNNKLINNEFYFFTAIALFEPRLFWDTPHFVGNDYLITLSPSTPVAGTPSILSMSETLKRLKRQTSTQRDKSALLHEGRYYVGLIFDSIM